MSARSYDVNGWYEIPDNPLSKSGIFEYLGASIGAPEPDRVYRVYRPEEELSDPKTLESFKLVPWIIEHEMLGEGERPAEQKGIQGIVGEDIKYEDGMIKGNIKVFSENLARLIDSGMNELSLGYKCSYDFTSGSVNGQPFDAIQKNIRGNHLATVEEGRMGSDVAVMDQATVTFDSREFKQMQASKKKPAKKPEAKTVKAKGTDEKEDTMDEESMDEESMDEGGSMTIEEMSSMMTKLMPLVENMEKLKSMMNGGGEESVEMEMGEESMEMEEDESVSMEKEEEEEGEDEKPDNEYSGMDSLKTKVVRLEKRLSQLNKKAGQAMDSKTLMKSISDRDALARKITRFTGTFDHSEMTTEEVAKYAVEKLSIPSQAGSEVTAVEAYLHNRKPLQLVAHNYGQDASNSNPVDSLFKGA